MIKRTIKALSFLAFGSLTTSARRLDYEKLEVYEPETLVTDIASIDYDQASIDRTLALGTEEAFENAKAIYQKGGHSKSIAALNLTMPLTENVSEGVIVTGTSANGKIVSGTTYSDYSVGERILQIRYQISEDQDEHVGCQIGALLLVGSEKTEGCFVPSGNITIDGIGEYFYTYNVTNDNNNGRTLAGFSTLARSEMHYNCVGCPMPIYLKYYYYYGEFDYANEWVLAALEGRRTGFENGDADFGQIYSMDSRAEAVSKGIKFLNVLMYMIRETRVAVASCQNGCVGSCNEESVHSWDKAVALYVGATEANFLFALANTRCQDFRTCGATGDQAQGKAKVNYDLMRVFYNGQYNILNGNCDLVRENADRVAQLMTIPLIQGTLRYAYRIDYLNGGEKEKADGATFAASVLPLLHDCGESAAETVHRNMRMEERNTNFMDVKNAFEEHYGCIGVTCEDIGGLFNVGGNRYYPNADPCESQGLVEDILVETPSAATSISTTPITFGILISTAVAIAVHTMM